MNRILTILLVVTPLLAQAEGPHSIATFPFSGAQVDSSAARQVSDLLSIELARSDKVRIIDRSQVASTIGSAEACQADSCAIQAGRLLDVQDILLGSVGRIGESFTISARVVDVQSGRVLASVLEAASGSIDSAVAELVPRIARKLLSRLPTDTIKPSVQAKSPRNTPPIDPWVTRHKGFHPRIGLIVGYPSMLEAPLGVRAGVEWNGFGGAVGLSPTFPIIGQVMGNMDDKLEMSRLVPALTAYYAWRYLQFELTYGDVAFQDRGDGDGTKIATYSTNVRFDVGEPGGLSLFLGASVVRYWHNDFSPNDNTSGTIPLINFGLVLSN